MSGQWYFGAANWINVTAGNFVGTGAYTMAALVRPDGSNSRFFCASAGATEQHAIFLDTGHLYAVGDFSNGYGTLTANGTAWYVVAVCKPAGSAHYRFHVWPYTSAATGTMSHGESVGAGNHPNFTAAATQVGIGKSNGGGGNGVITVTALWDRALSDAELDTLVSSHLTAWNALSPKVLSSLQNWNGSTGVTDIAGTSTFVSLTGSVDPAADAPGFDFSLAPPPPTTAVWNGSTETPVTLAGVWNGSAIIAATATIQT
jgi:hypothetical protein